MKRKLVITFLVLVSTCALSYAQTRPTTSPQQRSGFNNRPTPSQNSHNNYNNNSINGISIYSPSYPVVIYINKQLASQPTNSFLVANLGEGNYLVTAFKQNSKTPVLEQIVHHCGVGITELVITSNNRPSYGGGNDDVCCPNGQFIRPMSSSDFDRFYKQVRSASFDDNKVAIVKNVARTNNFTSAQAKKLISSASFSSGKLDMAKILCPVIVDRENIYTLESCFSFSSDKDKFWKIANREY